MVPGILNCLFLFLWTRCLVILSRGNGSEFMSASYGVKKNDVLLNGVRLAEGHGIL